MKIAIIVHDTLQFVGTYDSDSPDYGRFGGEWGSPQVTVHLEVPEGLDPMCLMAVKDSETGLITLQEDPSKLAAKTEAQWTALRSQRDSLLTQSDWRVLPFAPLSPETQQAWVTYRQALRDLPGVTQDPLNVEWPQVPS
jgi:hypothetical protein